MSQISYDRYFQTGLLDMPTLPQTWEVRKLSDVIRSLHTGLNPRKFFVLDSPGARNFYVTIREMVEGRIVFGPDTAHINDEALRLCARRSCLEKGDVLFSGTGTIGEVVLLEDDPGNWNIKEGIYALKPDQKRVTPKYLSYAVQSYPFRSRALVKSVGTGVKSVPMKVLQGFPVPVPPLSEQRAVSRYLDEKCAKIDRLVAAKTKEVELLGEYKQRLIFDAVTRGLDKSVKPRDSGIAWLGQVPEHWEVCNLRRLLRMVSRKGHGDKQLLSVTREQGVIVRNVESKEANHNFIPEDLSNYKLVEKGDFAINKMKSWQGSYGVSSYEGIVSPAYYVCRLTGVDKEFFSVAIRSKAYIGFFAKHSKGIRVDQWDLSSVGLKTIPFFLPPADEQRAIVAYIEEKSAKIDGAMANFKAQIERLKEYKQRLIADVVTGQIKVA